jgi:hypothetical protein
MKAFLVALFATGAIAVLTAMTLPSWADCYGQDARVGTDVRL